MFQRKPKFIFNLFYLFCSPVVFSSVLRKVLKAQTGKWKKKQKKNQYPHHYNTETLLNKMNNKNNSDPMHC